MREAEAGVAVRAAVRVEAAAAAAGGGGGGRNAGTSTVRWRRDEEKVFWDGMGLAAGDVGAGSYTGDGLGGARTARVAGAYSGRCMHTRHEESQARCVRSIQSSMHEYAHSSSTRVYYCS